MELETQPIYGRKVFIASSTIDLLDVRAEVRSYLHELGLMPLMYEHSFENARDPQGGASDRCDLNVQGADAVVVILSARYGTYRPMYFPATGQKTKPSFEPSYTHAEYLEARRLGKPVHFYARSPLKDAFERWVVKVKPELKRELHEAQGAWGEPSLAVRRVRLPAVLARVQKCEIDDFPPESRPSSSELEELKSLYGFLLCQRCWPRTLDGLITPFHTVVDLKEHLRNDLEANRLVANYEDLLRAGKLPFVRVVNARPDVKCSVGQDVYLRLTNVAPTAAAFDSLSGVYVAPRDRTRSLFLDRRSLQMGLSRGDLPLKVDELNWSPAAPSVLRDGEERIVRVCMDHQVPGARWTGADLAGGFCVWVVYQSVLGESFHVADQYDVTRLETGTWSIAYGGKRMLPPEADRGVTAERTEPERG